MPPKNHRRCISCGLVAPKDYFYQVIRNFPDHHITINQGMGRSAYVCPTLECITVAQKKKRLGKTLRTNVPPEIYDQLKSRC